MKRLLVLACSLAGAVAPAFAQFTGSENFNAALGGNWGSVISANTGTGSGGLAQGSNVLNFTATIGAGSGNATQTLPWTLNTGVSNADWSVTLAVNNAWTLASTQERVDIGLVIWNTSDSNDYVRLLLQKSDFSGTGGPANRNVFHSSVANNSSTLFTGDSSGGIGDTGTIGISYDSATCVISTFYDVGSGWTQIGSFGVFGSGGATGNTNWGVVSSFSVGIIGVAINNTGAGMSVASGLTADNFALSASEISAIPEPSTYAALLGFGAMGAAWLRRRRQLAA
jgi:hypothetical protein